MNTFTQDLKTALKSMGNSVLASLIHMGKIALIFSIVVAISIGVGYCFIHYFFQSLTVFVMSMLTAWFWIELETARKIREYDEKWDAFHAEKRKPMHGEK